jgi:hypothetical protein
VGCGRAEDIGDGRALVDRVAEQGGRLGGGGESDDSRDEVGVGEDIRCVEGK